jgi:hypothetical protein
LAVAVSAFTLLLCDSASLLAQACFPVPSDLVGWWPGDGTPQNLAFGEDAELGGASYTNGKVNEAFSFDGVDDYVSLGSSPRLNFGTGDFTIDFWVKFASLGFDNNGLLHKDNYSHTVPVVARGIVFNQCENCPGGGGIGFETRDNAPAPGNPDPWQGPRANARYPTSHFQAGQWYHLAAVRRSNVIYLYVDGVLRATEAEPSPIDISNDVALEIGRINDRYQFFAGDIDELELHSRALSEVEIMAIHAAGGAGKCKDADGDGFRPPEDCDETNADVHPGAAELPGNFVDENCDGSLGSCDPCHDWPNHGQYVRCVAHDTNLLVEQLLISDEQGDALVSSAAQSSIGKKGHVAPKCQ